MPDTLRQIAKTIFQRNQRREKEINDAFRQEQARRDATIKNMYRFRALRIARYEKAKTAQSSKPVAWCHERRLLPCVILVRNLLTVTPLHLLTGDKQKTSSNGSMVTRRTQRHL